MRQSHLILSNALIIWVSQILGFVPQLVLVPYLISTIGEADYGIYALVWSLIVSIDSLAGSLQQGVIKYSAEFLAQGRMQEVNRIVSSGFIYSIILAFLACSVIFATAALYNGPFGRIGSALAVLGIMVLFIVPLIPYVSIIESSQRYYVGAIASLISQYTGLAILMLWFNLMTPSFEALIVIMTGMLFFARLVQVPVAYRLIPGLQNRLYLFDRESFQLIVHFGAAMFLISVCLAANSTGTRWLMSTLASPTFVAHLAIILMPLALFSRLIGAITFLFMPAASTYAAIGNQQMLKELLLRGVRYITILVLAGVLVAAILMKDILTAWVGSNYAFLAPYALALLVGSAFRECTSIAHHMLKGFGKLRAIVFIYFIGLVMVPAAVILFTFQNWHNAYIAATAGLVAGYLVCGCLQLAVCIKTVHVDFQQIFMYSYAQPLVIAAVVYLSALGIITATGIDNFVGRAGVAMLVLVLFFSGCYGLIATSDERQQVKEIVQTAKNKLVLVPK